MTWTWTQIKFKINGRVIAIDFAAALPVVEN
jgi:hypothetical protein